MNKFEEYNMHLDAIRKLVAENGEDMVEGFFKTIFAEHKNLDIVLVQGYTPSFNDGDACYHKQYNIVDVNEINDTVDVWDILDAADEEFEEVLDNLNAELSEDEWEEIDTKLDSIKELLERVYDTDFYVFAMRKEDGSIEFNNGDYDCGY